jgi:hypothetical protein
MGAPYKEDRASPNYGALTMLNRVEQKDGCTGQWSRAKGVIVKDWQKHTTGGIPRWSPTLVLVARFSAYVWQSGRSTRLSPAQHVGKLGLEKPGPGSAKRGT